MSQKRTPNTGKLIIELLKKSKGQKFLVMLNMFKKETHRLFQDKIFWITQIAVLIFTIIELIGLFVNGGMSGATVTLRLGGHSYIRFYILALLFLILEEEFVEGKTSDISASGLSRGSFLCTKLLVFGAFLLLQIVISYVKDLVAGLFFGGLSFFTLQLFKKLVCHWLVLWVLLFAITVVSFLVFELTRSVLASFVTGIFLPLFINIVHIIGDFKGIFKYIDFIQVMGTISSITFAQLGNIAPTLLGAAAILLTGCVLTVVIFNRLDLQLFQQKGGIFFE